MALHLKPPDRFVAYYSTAQQGRSGLGLEAQREAVRAFLASTGGTVAEGFTEVESGKNADRPQLAKALDACRLTGAVLVIAKLDRLSRDCAFPARAGKSRRGVCRRRHAERQPADRSPDGRHRAGGTRDDFRADEGGACRCESPRHKARRQPRRPEG
jgi:hypothetical protein